MQITNKHNLEKRILYYWSKIYSSEIKKGQDYNELKKVKAILIVDYDIEQFNNIMKYKTDWKIRETDNHNMILTEDLEIIIIELPKTVYTIKERVKEEYNKKLYDWLKFLKNPEGLGEEEMKNVNIRKAKEIYEEVEQDEHERYLAHLREKYIRDKASDINYGYNNGLKDGIEKGKKSGIKMIAKRLLKENMEIPRIAIITGLSEEEIRKI